MGEVEVTAEMVGVGRAVLEAAASGCPESIVGAAIMLGDYLVDMYRAMRALDPEIKELEKIRDAYEEVMSAAEDRRFC